MWILWIVLWIVLAILIVAILAIAGFYAFFGLAKANILWTIVEEGWCRIILKWGKYHRTISPGLRWVGIPGLYTLYKREMTFLKSITDKDGEPQAEPHEDKDISSFKITHYAYAFPFKDEEDSHGLHLSGILVIIAIIEDYEKAFFVASDWYSIMNTKIMPRFRTTLARISYDDDIVGRDTEEEQDLPGVDKRLWKAVNDTPTGGSSIRDELLNDYGINIKSVELRSVDAPEDWRATTLAPYKAQREADAAKFEAAKEAEVGSRVLRIVANRCGLKIDKLKERLAQNPSLIGKSECDGGFREAFAYAEDQTKRDRAGSGLEDIRVGNVDGTPLEPGIATIASMFGLGKRQGSRRKSGTSSENPASASSGKKGRKKRGFSPKEIKRISKTMSSEKLAKLLMEDDEDEEEEEEEKDKGE